MVHLPKTKQYIDCDSGGSDVGRASQFGLTFVVIYGSQELSEPKKVNATSPNVRQKARPFYQTLGKKHPDFFGASDATSLRDYKLKLSGGTENRAARWERLTQLRITVYVLFCLWLRCGHSPFCPFSKKSCNIGQLDQSTFFQPDSIRRYTTLLLLHCLQKWFRDKTFEVLCFI